VFKYTGASAIGGSVEASMIDQKKLRNHGDSSEIGGGDYGSLSPKNERLNTPGLRKISGIPDGAFVLRSEISESLKRVKAAKYGTKLNQIMPNHSLDFYLPDK
jgi:hypothetical protein